MNSVNNKYEALILSYLDGRCSAEEALELLSWVAESEENRLYFKALKDQNEVWNLTDFAMPELDESDVNAALDAVNTKIDAIEETETKVVQMPWIRRNYRYVSGVAAAFLIALFVGFLVRNPFNSTVTYAFNGQNESSFVLPDGTSVNFDSESTITYPEQFDKSSRSVDFEGVAYFDVTKDENRPFVIHCNNMDVEVLGTTFLLNADKDMERYFVDPNNHVLVFDNESLSKIVEALEYLYKVEIELDEACAAKKLTARFSDEESIDEVLETIAIVSEVTVTKSDGAYQIR